MSKSIFRKKSIEKLSSPEQLDQLMQVTTAKGWIALVTLCALLGGAVLWGFVGRIPTRVRGTGVLIKTGGIYGVAPLSSGRITDISVRSGDRVEQGQVIARIDQPDLVDAIKQAKARLEELRAQHRELGQFMSRDTELQAELMRQQRKNFKESMRYIEKRITWLNEKIVSQRDLFEEGLITKQALLGTKQQLQSAREETDQLRSKLKQVSVNTLSARNQRRQELTGSRLRIVELERELARLEEQLEADTEITSPHTGRILEVMVKPGDVVGRSQAVVRLERSGGNIQHLQAVIYIPATDGKKVEAGMEVLVSPTTVQREKFGSMRAVVERVSDFPATPKGMQRVLKNNQLIKVLSAQRAPYEMYANFELDAATPSGYAWTSSGGPNERIQSGTMCLATVTVKVRRPIELVLPFLKDFFGV